MHVQCAVACTHNSALQRNLWKLVPILALQIGWPHNFHSQNTFYISNSLSHIFGPLNSLAEMMGLVLFCFIGQKWRLSKVRFVKDHTEDSGVLLNYLSLEANILSLYTCSFSPCQQNSESDPTLPAITADCGVNSATLLYDFCVL